MMKTRLKLYSISNSVIPWQRPRDPERLEITGYRGRCRGMTAGKLTLLTSLLALSACASTTPSPSAQNKFNQGKASFISQDYKQAFEDLIIPANEGNSEAQYAIGYMYYYGKGLKQDKDLGETWIKKAANNGNADAKQALKLMAEAKISEPTAAAMAK